MPKKKTMAQLKKLRWKLFSEYIRKKARDEDGYVTCVTCGKKALWNDGMQAGHFIPKAKGNSVYFEEENCHVQDISCNIFKSGNYIEYTLYMLDMYGREKIDELEALAKTELKFTRSDHEEAIEDLKQKIKELG